MKKSKKKIILIAGLVLCSCILVGLIGLIVKLLSGPMVISVDATRVWALDEDDMLFDGVPYFRDNFVSYQVNMKIYSMKRRMIQIRIGTGIYDCTLNRGTNYILIDLPDSDEWRHDGETEYENNDADNPQLTRISELQILDDGEVIDRVDFRILEIYKPYSLHGKPVIYLYPEEETEVNVELDFHGDLTCTYPAYNDGWNVIASPDGTLTNLSDGRTYDYLFWEGNASAEYPMDNAICVKGEDTCAFLEEYLTAAGLNDSEIDDFITYWLPEMQDNPYNLIAFQGELYEQVAELHVTPEPNSVLRIFMTFEALDEPVECGEFSMPEPFERNGFTVVEWGGTELEKQK